MTSSIRNNGSGTMEISNIATDLAKRTEHQIASLEETAAALNELRAEVNSSAENARTAATNVGLAIRGAEEPGEIVRKAIASMKVCKARQKCRGSSASSLASRSGKAGKDFAVVSEEVRKLAKCSAVAAKETGTLISACVFMQDKKSVEMVLARRGDTPKNLRLGDEH